MKCVIKKTSDKNENTFVYKYELNRAFNMWTVLINDNQINYRAIILLINLYIYYIFNVWPWLYWIISIIVWYLNFCYVLTCVGLCEVLKIFSENNFGNHLDINIWNYISDKYRRKWWSHKTGSGRVYSNGTPYYKENIFVLKICTENLSYLRRS